MFTSSNVHYESLYTSVYNLVTLFWQWTHRSSFVFLGDDGGGGAALLPRARSLHTLRQWFTETLLIVLNNVIWFHNNHTVCVSKCPYWLLSTVILLVLNHCLCTCNMRTPCLVMISQGKNACISRAPLGRAVAAKSIQPFSIITFSLESPL